MTKQTDIDTLEKDFKTTVSNLADKFHNEQRVRRILAISLALDIILTAGLGIVTLRTVNNSRALSKANEASIARNCGTINRTNAVQLKLWTTILSNPVVAGAGLQQQFQPYVEKAFAQEKC